ncbi:MAG: hypothetical protein M3362_00175 [Acidobacteriota bacterium]|nr:hypothetical protein [Acidobacteriota bacterium]
MRATGTITYQINLPEVQGTADVSAQLSSELQKETSTDPKNSTDVSLVLNGRGQGVQRVVPDNEVGTTYHWTVPGDVFKAGNNTLTFEVKKGQYANGLCIYGPIQIAIKPTASKPSNDLSDTYAIYGETVYNKKTMTVFATPQEFMQDSGKTTVHGWVFDRVSTLPPGLHFIDGRPMTSADYQRAK